MQLNETIVIGFLVVVILVLIFSKISVKLNSDNNDSNTRGYNLKRTKRMNNSRNDNNSREDDDNKIKSPDYNLKTSGLLSNDFKKQLDEIENRFYTSSCSISK